MQTAPIPLILDVDTGYDDALALMLALRSPALDVRAVTCVAGNQPLDQVVTNTLKVLDLADAPPVPVAAGMSRPLLEPMRPPFLIHGHDGMADLGLPASPRTVVAEHAVELLRRTVEAAEQPVHLVALAPLTNMAVFLGMYPHLHTKIAGLTVMGGAFGVPGNTSPAAEFNIRQDPEAAKMVLESGLPIRLYGLDVFRSVRLTRTQAEMLAAAPDPAAQAAGRILRYACDFTGRDDALIGDAGAVATLIDPAPVRVEEYPVTVVLADGVARGQTVFDRRLPRYRQELADWWPASPSAIQVCVEVDGAAYAHLFMDALLPGG